MNRSAWSRCQAAGDRVLANDGDIKIGKARMQSH